MYWKAYFLLLKWQKESFSLPPLLLVLASEVSLDPYQHFSPWRASQVVYPPANAGDGRDVGSISGSGRSPGEGNGNPLQHYSCLKNSMDRGAWQVAKIWRGLGTVQQSIAGHSVGHRLQHCPAHLSGAQACSWDNILLGICGLTTLLPSKRMFLVMATGTGRVMDRLLSKNIFLP